ncbi:hypothetical protein B0H21DRAFT_697935 [Amylocystis lapponica]|nr:hypothetical protein B0H21DRAFT_697935 [Amylocystis lapponica]
MSSADQRFLFASLDSKQPTTARKVHVRRLFDILQLSVQRNDIARARRAWAILVRCKEIHWKTMWTTAIPLIGEDVVDEEENNEQRIKFLTTMRRQYADDGEAILKELVLRLIKSGMYRRALDELDLYLPSLPYQDNPVLHVYAGLAALYLAQPPADLTNGEDTNKQWDPSLLRDAQTHFERAKALDPANAVAAAFLEQVRTLHTITALRIPHR